MLQPCPLPNVLPKRNVMSLLHLLINYSARTANAWKNNVKPQAVAPDPTMGNMHRQDCMLYTHDFVKIRCVRVLPPNKRM